MALPTAPQPLSSPQSSSSSSCRTTTEASRKKSDAGKRFKSGALLDHVRQFYDFAWNGGMFRLDDENDSVNFGDLSVSPPPSGESITTCRTTTKIFYFIVQPDNRRCLNINNVRNSILLATVKVTISILSAIT